MSEQLSEITKAVVAYRHKKAELAEAPNNIRRRLAAWEAATRVADALVSRVYLKDANDDVSTPSK